MKSRSKLVGIVLMLVMVAAGAAIYYSGMFDKKPITYIPREVKIHGVFLANSKKIDDFHLQDHKGNEFSKNNLLGHWTMIFFGFTNCGHVCPTTMTELNHMYQQLQSELPKDQLPQVVLVTVDPERDSISRMNDYINAFNTNFIGVRAELPETAALEKQLGVAAVKMSENGQINHSAEIFLINPDGMLQAYLSFPSKADQLAKDYKTILLNNIS